MLDNHLATTCDFSMIPCPNKCSDELFGKTLQVARKDLERHLNEDCPNREYKCALCGKKDKYYEMKWFHHKTCPKTITPCPNGCAVEMERQHTKEHVATECELTPVHCKYRRLGCSVILKRGDMAAHEEDDKLHLCMAIDKTASLEKGLERAFNRISTLEVIASELGAKQQKAASNIATLQRDYSAIGDDLASELNKLFLDLQRDAKSVTIKMTGYDSKRLNSTRFVSPSFNCTSESQGYNVLITVNPNGLGQGSRHTCSGTLMAPRGRKRQHTGLAVHRRRHLHFTESTRRQKPLQQNIFRPNRAKPSHRQCYWLQCIHPSL